MCSDICTPYNFGHSTAPQQGSTAADRYKTFFSTMPIYAYKCDSCGHAKDVLQKMSDAPLSACPQCGALTFKKQLTSAGFQLKGSGWYVTDFRNGNAGAASEAPAKSGEAHAADAKPGTAKPADGAVPAPVSSPAGPAAAAPASSAATTNTPV